MTNRRKWLCLDCSIDTGKAREHYFLADSVWLSVAPKVGMLCIGCVEARLGRELTPEDFTDAWINKGGQRSMRLLYRQGNIAVLR